MPTNYTTRVFLILTVLVIALIAIFPPASLFDHNLTFSQKLGLKPGIDMVGGTSLTYEIKPPEGGIPAGMQGTLAEHVMEPLKKRVDPNGVMNLVWRPQGDTRLEIQMPTAKGAGESKAKREAFAAAQSGLEQTNVRTADVIHAVESLTGDVRDKKLAELAMGSATREKLFKELATTYDQIQQAKAKKDAAAQADREIAYDQLKSKIDDTNLPASALEATLGLPPATRDPKLAEFKKAAADFPARLHAIDQFQRDYAEYIKIKSTLDDASDLKRLLRGSGVLEFHILVDYSRATPPPDVQQMIDRLKKRGPVVQAGDTMRWYAVDRPEEFKGQTVLDAQGNPFVLAYTTPDKSMTSRTGEAPWSLEDAQAQRDGNSGERLVAFTFDAQGAKYFGDLSGGNLQKQLGIVLDDKMISAPTLQSKITAHGQITGNRAEGGFTEKEQSYLVSMLSAGSLPARLTDEPISEVTIGPQLGADNLHYGLISCGVGLVIVMIFLVSYYYIAGIIATFAVLLNVVIILGVMAMFKATFTLPAVAGIVLTIGAAVDANVLIFERLREEQQRGLSLRMALRNAYDRAFSAIVDSNATTVVTSLFLFMFGSEEVKGFGLTLLIGLISSLFTALYVTKTIFGLLIDKGHITNLGSLPLTFPKWDKALKPDWNWMKIVPFFVTLSAVLIVLGCGTFVWKTYQGEMADIEFASGTSMEFALKSPMPIEEVRKLLTAPDIEKDLPSPSIYVVGSAGLEYKVDTPSDKPEVKNAVLRAMGNRMKVELPSAFKGLNQSVEQAQTEKIILPIESADMKIDGFAPPHVTSYIGGAAIVLRDLTPPLSPKEIGDRIDAERLLQTKPGASNYRDYMVEAATGPDKPTSVAVVLTGDSDLPYDQDPLKWRDQVVTPMWKLVNDAVHKSATLQRVTTFNPQVAGEAQRDAALAITLSIVAIMAYIWLRFGNLKYGTATVVAMIHDTLLVIGFIGLSHLIFQHTPWLAKVLMIEPFRINLTIVAAVLTVMSYSMIDTIVVFDRVRENRGKFGHLSRRVVNDSINQTLSRTLLTGGTNLMTVLVMYILGGPGIHGFTFVLLTGILVGTYSSVAIAAPILLIGGDKEEPSAGSGGASKAIEGRKGPAPVGQLQRA